LLGAFLQNPVLHLFLPLVLLLLLVEALPLLTAGG
jgi:hypothetical protein